MFTFMLIHYILVHRNYLAKTTEFFKTLKSKPEMIETPRENTETIEVNEQPKEALQIEQPKEVKETKKKKNHRPKLPIFY